jgi:formamidopyrimidine-DNA glycosylase
MGVDPVAEDLPAAALRRILAGRRRQLKALLVDQHVIAGIGNIYADEILHRARLRPERTSDTVTRDGANRLHAAIHDVLTHAIAAGGSTLRDAQYVDLFGAGGSFQDEHRVYGRGGERCLTCGRGTVRRIVVAQRSTHFCPVCQR